MIVKDGIFYYQSTTGFQAQLRVEHLNDLYHLPLVPNGTKAAAYLYEKLMQGYGGAHTPDAKFINGQWVEVEYIDAETKDVYKFIEFCRGVYKR